MMDINSFQKYSISNKEKMTEKNIDSDQSITSISDLKYLKFETQNSEFIATLIDEQEYEILKGYGKTKTEALNDLHNNLI